MYSAGVIKRLEKSHNPVWEDVSSQSEDRASRVEVPSIRALSDVDPYSASEKCFSSLRTSIVIVVLGISLFLWYWLFQLGYYLLGIFV